MNGVTYDVRAGSDIPAFTISPFLLTHTISSLDVVDHSNVDHSSVVEHPARV